jgi:hypothetical protein
MGPPISATPSMASFDSLGSGTDSGRDFEVNRLKHLLNASQEDFRLQQQQFAEERERLRRRNAEERAMYEARIQELERQSLGNRGGPGGFGEGSRRG